MFHRFSKDMGVIDKELPIRVYFTKISWMQVLVITGMTVALNYWLVIPTIVASLVMYLVLNVYIKTSRNVKRLDGISKLIFILTKLGTLSGLMIVIIKIIVSERDLSLGGIVKFAKASCLGDKWETLPT